MKITVGSLLLAAALGLAPALAATPVTLELRLPAGATPGGAVRAKVSLAPAVGHGEYRTAEVDLPGSVVLNDLPAVSAWRVVVEAAGYWSQPEVATVEPEPSRTVVDLLPAGRVAGQVRTPPDQRPPAELILRFRSVPGAPRALAEVTESCAIGQEGRFECTVPAGELDLRLRARGFLTHNFWGVKVPPGGAFQTGALLLRPGASVVGWITPPDREFRYSDCAVTLKPYQIGSPPSLTDLERSATLGQKEPVNSRGYFEVTGVAPGAYQLVVRHSRYAPAVISPLSVLPGAETEIHTVVLVPAVDLEIRLEPPRSPEGAAWGVTLLRKGTDPQHLVTVHQGPTSAEGVLRVPALAPGPYELEVTGGRAARWAFGNVEVYQGMAPHVVRLPLVEVEGEVVQGDQPLPAFLWFGGRFGAVRVPVKTDDEGSFRVTLPDQEAPWRVEILNAELQVDAVIPELPVRKAAGQTVARVRVEVPDTTVRGEVVDESGRPVAKAQVDAFGRSPGGSNGKTASREDGTFELRGLSPGSWDLEAWASDDRHGLHAEIVQVQLEDGQPVEGLRLVLRPRVALTGQVVGPSGSPIVGAQVFGVLEQVDRPLEIFLPDATTDVAGTFTLRLPGRATGVQLNVLAPGFALRQLRVDARSKEPLVIPVHQVGGAVVVVYEGGADVPEALKHLRTSIFHDSHVPPTVTLAWTEVHAVPEQPGRFEIPMLEPGPYTVCYDIYDQVYRTGRLPAELAPRCAHGDLAPYGRLELKLAVPEEASGKAAGSGGGAPP